ncbi:two-component regulator propeller domain-containing protein [Carboxylicivirga caseinilyticus]|uniref:hybrid sensor histidine kinase/response regulator n=1 Tax=Carboxylicivirga caseinilyticus TaxID=3417572 RepID=UPI003D3350A7|nr:response regulator [Marinilabiliaceae bacterium A049]
MRIQGKIFLLFIVLSLFTSSISAYEIKKLGLKDGLSNNNITSIAQDNDGMIWITTKDGLNRFDGHSFKVFRKSGNNSPGSNVLNFVYADKIDDIIWIATEKNGLDAYNYKTHQFKHYTHDYSGQTNSLIADGITYITSDNEGNLWFATYQYGLDRLNKETGEFTHYNQSNIKGLASNYNWCMLYESDECIYVGHVTDGMSIINIKNESAINFKHDPNDPNSLPDNTVTEIFKDSKGNIWVGTRGGLALFDPVNQTMTNFQHQKGVAGSLSNNFVQSIMETKDSTLWFGTEGGGVSIVDLKQFDNPESIFFEVLKASATSEGLSSSSVQSMYQDHYGNIWLGGFAGGLNLISSREPFFKKLEYLPIVGNDNSLNNQLVLGVCEDNDSNTWIANGDGGICIYDGKTKIKEITELNNSHISAQSVFKDSDGNIWIGTTNGLIYKYNKNNNQYKQIICFSQINNIPIYNFYEDSRKNLWISTDGGLLKYNIVSEEYFVYTVQNSSISDNIVRSVVEDKDGNIWVGTAIGGLCVFDPNFQLLYNYGREYDFYNINHLYIDSKNRVWVGSQNDLFCFNDTKTAKRIGKDDGLTETDIRAIVEGNSEGEMWFSTLNGISHYNLKTGQVINFNLGDGISMGDFTNGSILKKKDGTIYFGSQHGATFFNDNIDVFTNNLPKAFVMSFEAPAKANENFSEFTDVPFSEEMTLKYNENSFRINFNVADFSLTDKVDFMFQMVGLDDSWYLIKNENRVTFRNLRPGDYQFNLKARLHNKEWTDEFGAMKITIDPPIWLTWQAKTLYLVIFVLGIWFVLRFYKNKVEVENALVLEKNIRHQEHELNEEKIRFFTNIAHELRTPMTLLLGPLEDLVADKSLNESLTKKINSMHRVANRLLQLINQVLEFRRTENKKRELAVVKGDFASFIYETGLKYKELNHNEKIDFDIQLPEEKTEMLYDPEVVRMVLDNLLSNAFKYTTEGKIELKVRRYNDFDIEYTEFEVSDTGYGISEANLSNIFERYYQAKDTKHAVSGTGIGLALVKNLVELHQAEIKVTSELDKGTTFIVRFLTNNSYPGVKLISTHEEQLEDEEVLGDKNVILVVDDNQEITEYIYDSLSETYHVITANNGLIGYELACEKVPDIIISDIMMPVMDGIEMLKKMKSDIRTSHIPVILLTAKDTLKDKSEGYDAGADSYLTKPFSSNLLKSRLRNIFETRKKLSDSYSNKFEDKQQLFKEATNKLDQEFLEKLNQIIEDNLEDEEMNISQIAQHMNMSHSTLYRKIKALTDLTANEYIRKVRMKVAEQLLLSGKFTISEVMYRIGINSTGYFRQCFKDEYGISPSDYIRSLKNAE